MIQILSNKYPKAIAYFFLLVFYLSANLQARAGGRLSSAPSSASGNKMGALYLPFPIGVGKTESQRQPLTKPLPYLLLQSRKKFIGGPSQPEMTNFKSIGTDNMVNLFTGDFSYNIPLLDVGGYPVNIYYNGNIGMEQEASWVGLGWNINPGTVSRNMRGIPDDFDGTEMMVEQQNVKPNLTVGGSVGGDVEWNGIKVSKSVSLGTSIGLELGASVNNYLGPALDLKLKGGVNITLSAKTQYEKNAGGDTVVGKTNSVTGGLSGTLDLNSRSGATLSGAASLSGKMFFGNRALTTGLSASTSYNSRVGIKDVQITGQVSLTRQQNTGIYKCNDELGAEQAKTRGRSIGENLYSSTISFARPSYVPTIRMPMNNQAWSGHFQLGGAIGGIYGSVEADVYSQKSVIATTMQQKPLVGYMYFQNAVKNLDAVMDFSRIQDREVTGATPIIAPAQYTYDVFSIQGEGTGGVIRAYRTDLGYVRDNKVRSTDNSVAAGIDIGIPGHIGGNLNIIKTPTTSGKWVEGNNLDASSIVFQQGVDLHQLVYFRNPGEGTVLDANSLSRSNNIGGTDLVRYVIGGTQSSPTLEPALQHLGTDGNVNTTTSITNAVNPATSSNSIVPASNVKRGQVVTFFTAAEASLVGLDKSIKSYNPGLGAGNILSFRTIPRVGGYRLSHHISQINVTEADGKRYIYGLPVYNTTQTDFTFSVKSMVSDGLDPDVQQVNLGGNAADWMSVNSSLVTASATNGIDGYYQSTTTPAYAHSFLLSGLLSPDYVDVTGDGITEDDLGDAVKFNYSQITRTDGSGHKWRTPLTSGTPFANFNAGNRTETKDDKGIVCYGEREQWYLHSIESKTMVAVFTLGAQLSQPVNRKDGKGADGSGAPYNQLVPGGEGGATGTVDPEDNTVQLLDHIDLYNKSDLKANGLIGANGARPIKTIHFIYSHRLCNGTPDNPSGADGGGKLTLERIYFTFNGQQRSNKTQYVFSYTYPDGTGNPGYETNATDRWGTYKPNPTALGASTSILQNPALLPNKDYPYSLQPSTPEGISTVNSNAGAWALKRILLPSGGQINVTYESKDYAYVQNLHAQQMMQVLGFDYRVPGSATRNPGGSSLYSVPVVTPITDNFYVYIKVPTACVSKQDVLQKYLAGFNSLTQIAFKYSVIMPSGKEEYLTSYAQVDQDDNGFICGPTNGTLIGDNTVIWLKLKAVDGYSPLTLTALEYLREQLPGQAFEGYDMSNFKGGAVKEIASLIGDMLNGLGELFTSPIDHFRAHGKARFVGQYHNSAANSQTLKCFVRLNCPTGQKYGGGSRVKQITLTDNWDKMAGQHQSTYGQVYDYTTTELQPGGTVATISSGVASYEPAIGGEENPFATSKQYENRLPMGPASYGAVEMPILDALFPSPLVGYSKVTVRSLADIEANSQTSKLTKSRIGKQVTEFYTAKDFPVIYSNTLLDAGSNVQDHEASLVSFWHKSAFDSRAISQGFLVTTNDMHGKMKSQASYAANNENLQVGYTQYFYSNTGPRTDGSNDSYSFVDGLNNGKVTQGHMGIDVELMTDIRQFTVSSSSKEFQVQLDLYPIFAPIWLPFPWYVGGTSQSIFRSVTATKVVSYHSVVDKVLSIDKGSQVITSNLVRDGHTGGVLVTQTNNEFEKPIYSTTYPAYWAYGGMGPAYQNIDVPFSGASFSNGIINSANQQGIQGPIVSTNLFESGDELLITQPITVPTDCDYKIASPPPSSVDGNGLVTAKGVDVVWVLDQKKNTSSLTQADPDFIFMDAAGKPYTNYNVSFRIIRSGKRNMLGSKIQAVTNMNTSPVVTNTDGTQRLAINASNNVVNASAVEYREKWQTDKDEVKGYVYSCPAGIVQSCNLNDPTYHLDSSINPYCKGLLGNFRLYRDLVYFAGRNEHDIFPGATSPYITNLPANGFLDPAAFALYWRFNDTIPGMLPLYTREANATSNWVFKSRTTRVNARGLELETNDALNINTAAQYGFNKTLPVAIANNAGYAEMAYEGFEDNGYDNSLNNSNYVQICPDSKHIDFGDMLQNGIGNILNTSKIPDVRPFNAHTGKYVMAINPGKIAVKTIPVTAYAPDEFNIAVRTKTRGLLADPGVNYSPDAGPNTPYALSNTQETNSYPVANNSTSVDFTIYPLNKYTVDNLSGNIPHYFNQFGMKWDTYINITEAKDYHFSQSLNSSTFGSWPPQLSMLSQNMDATITDESGRVTMGVPQSAFYSESYNPNLNPSENSYTTNKYIQYTLFLCPGIYHVSGSIGNTCVITGKSTNGPNTYDQTLGFHWGCSDCGSPVYADTKTTPAPTCATYTAPIAADSAMLHPSFMIPPKPSQDVDKEMVFSAWVREDGATATTTNYGANSVQLQFVTTDGTVLTQKLYDANGKFTGQGTSRIILTPRGPIIDGWQRYEGYFSAPTNTSSLPLNLQLSFVNGNQNGSVYFDDIRVHPFNADMKGYVYDPITQRLVAQLDANNYASFYEYDEEGTLIATKAETVKGIKTISETRSAKQKNITDIQ